MIRRHVTQHGSTTEGDALDALGRQDEVLRSLFDEWDATGPGQSETDPVTAAWDHGTVGKLVLEHGVVRLAAQQDVAAALRGVGQDDLAGELDGHHDEARELLARIADLSKGVQPINLRFTPEFAASVDRLCELWRAELSGAAADTARIASALGPGRSQLQSAHYLRKHSPTHPSPKSGGLSSLSIVSRLRTTIDRVRGWPWAESDVADAKLAERFDREDG